MRTEVREKKRGNGTPWICCDLLPKPVQTQSVTQLAVSAFTYLREASAEEQYKPSCVQ